MGGDALDFVTAFNDPSKAAEIQLKRRQMERDARIEEGMAMAQDRQRRTSALSLVDALGTGEVMTPETGFRGIGQPNLVENLAQFKPSEQRAQVKFNQGLKDHERKIKAEEVELNKEERKEQQRIKGLADKAKARKEELALKFKQQKELIKLRRGLGAKKTTAIDAINAGLESGSLKPDASVEDVQGFLAGTGVKVNSKDIESIVDFSRKQKGGLKEAPSWLSQASDFLSNLLPSTVASPAAPVQSDMVKVKDPKSGKVASIPRSNLAKAKQRGLVEVK